MRPKSAVSVEIIEDFGLPYLLLHILFEFWFGFGLCEISNQPSAIHPTNHPLLSLFPNYHNLQTLALLVNQAHPYLLRVSFTGLSFMQLAT